VIILEAFTTLLRDPNHWYFELLVGGIEEIVFGIVIGAVVWPKIKQHIHRDVERGVEKPMIPHSEGTDMRDCPACHVAARLRDE
jgi:hypothetical protein